MGRTLLAQREIRNSDVGIVDVRGDGRKVRSECHSLH